MTIDAFTRAAVYTVQGIGPYMIPHPYASGAVQVSIVIDGAPVSLPDGDYSVTPETSDERGDVYLSNAAAALHAGRALWIDRATPAVQIWEARTGEREVGLEAQLDHLTMAVQEIRGQLAGAARVRGDVAPFVPADGRAVIWKDGAFAAGPLASEIATAAEFAEEAVKSAAVLNGLARRDVGTFVTSSAVANGRGPYALPYNPLDPRYLDLTLNGLRQVPGRDFSVVAMPSASSGWGVLFATDLPSGLVCDYALVRPLAADPNAKTLTLEQFGVIGDGHGDQGPAIATAIAAAAGRKLVGTAGATYRIATPVSYTGGIDLDLSMSRVVVPADITPFVFKAPALGPFALRSDYVAGATTLEVTDLPTAPKAGQVVWISSRARDPGDRDNGSSSQQYRVGEAFRLGAGSTENSLVLQAPLAHGVGISPTSSAGDEARVPAYTVALDTRLALIDMDARCNVSLPIIEFEDGHDLDGWSKGAVEVWGYFAPVIRHGGVSRGYGPAVRTWGTYAASIEGASASNLVNNEPTQLGYGVADAGWATRVIGLTAHNVRHAYTTSKSTSSYAVETFDAYKVLTFGRTAAAQIVGGIGSGGVSAVWNTHQDAQDILFSGNTADGCGTDGFAIRGRNITVANPILRNCGAGIRYFTEYDSGDPDDDLFNNGKLLSDFTSGLIDSPQMDVRGRCIDVRAATVVLAGAGRYRTQSDCLIYNSGGTLTIGGTHRFVLDGSSEDAGSDAIIHIGANTAYSSAAFPEPNIVIDGIVEIDARLWTGPALTAIKTVAGTTLIVRGILRLVLPAGSTLMSAPDGTVVCEGAGIIQYAIGDAVGSISTALISPDQFGAVGDGVADDTAALERWTAAIQGKVGIIEDGKHYRTSQEIILSADNTKIIGGGTIEQTTWGYMAVGVWGNNCRVDCRTLSTQTKTMLSEGMSSRYRGDTARARCAGIYVVGDGFRSKNPVSQGFVCGINLTGQRVWRRNVTITGATTTTLPLHADDARADDLYIGKPMRIMNVTGGGYVLITGYDQGTNTVTFEPALSVAPNASGIYYVIHLAPLKDVKIGDMELNHIDFGLVGGWVDGVHVGNITSLYGENTQQVAAPPHTVYFTGDSGYLRAANVTIGDCHTIEHYGSAYKFRGVDGLTLGQMFAHRARGIGTIENCTNVITGDWNGTELGVLNENQPVGVTITGGRNIQLGNISAVFSDDYVWGSASVLYNPIALNILDDVAADGLANVVEDLSYGNVSAKWGKSGLALYGVFQSRMTGSDKAVAGKRIRGGLITVQAKETLGDAYGIRIAYADDHTVRGALVFGGGTITVAYLQSTASNCVVPVDLDRGHANAVINNTGVACYTPRMTGDIGVMTVGNLPPAAKRSGCRAIVTDALSPVLGNVAVGGGSIRASVNCDGTNWRIG